MSLSGCGICLYGMLDKKNPKSNTVKCMLQNYELKKLTDKCNQYQRDYRKSFAEQSNTNKEK